MLLYLLMLVTGWPWKYDRRSLHDGYKNTLFVKYGEKIILDPKPEVIAKPLKMEGIHLVI